MEGLVLAGLASAAGQAKLTIRSLPPTMNAMTGIMSALAAEGISVDTLTPGGPRGRPPPDAGDDRTKSDLERALEICRGLVTKLGGEAVDVQRA
jgi:hypothetical protein